MNNRFIYADNSATTPLSKTALDAMLPWLSDNWGNPSSIYKIARDAQTALVDARKTAAECLGAKPDEIFFTSGGTESDNWAIKCGAWSKREKGKYIITSAIEHHAVLETADRMKELGFEVTVLPVDEYGMVSPESLEKAIRDDTVLVTIMLANNEIGTIQPIKKLAEIAHAHGALFHTDAVQAVGHIPVNTAELGVDMLSLSAHKFGGPKGVGILYIRRGVRIPDLLDGGGQERGRRAGTENLAGICGMVAAMKASVDAIPEVSAHLVKMRDRLFEGLLKIPYTQRTGHPTERLPGLCSVVINYIEGESIILMLDFAGICASSGSACTSGSLDPSHVLLAIGLPHEVAHGSLRLSLPDNVTEEDIDYIIEQVTGVTEQLRAMSPVWPGSL